MSRNPARPIVLILLIALASLGLVGGSAAWAASTVDQSQEDTIDGVFLVSSAMNPGQTFTVGRSGSMDKVEIRVAQNAGTSSADVMTVAIRSVDTSGTPTETTPLATAQIPSNNVPYQVPDWITAQFATPLEVESGERYALVVTSDADPFAPSVWAYSEVDPYAGGSSYHRLDRTGTGRNDPHRT